MKSSIRTPLFAAACALAAGALAGTLAMSQATKENKPTRGSAPTAPAKTPPGGDMKAPPGVSEEDMKACMAAATPGPMHQFLASHAGVWEGKTSMWMTPGSEPMMSDCVSTITVVMDGRFCKCETMGEMPGAGPFVGFGLTGFDNVSQKFVGSWADNMGTGIMQGTGEMSKDGKTISWNYTMNCPIQKKPVVMRQIENYPDANTMSFEMFGPDPHTGKEFKCMRIDFKRKN